jgi:hypothetical protein
LKSALALLKWRAWFAWFVTSYKQANQRNDHEKVFNAFDSRRCGHDGGVYFWGQAHAQTAPPATGKYNAAAPDPKGGIPARAGADASSSSDNPVAKSATMTPGTTNPLDNVSPAPAGGKAKSVEERNAAKMAKDARDPAKAAKRAARKPPPDDTTTMKAGSTY